MRQRKPSTTIFQEIFDANADGNISAAELEEALKKLGSVTHDDVNRMMTEIDTDGDGNIVSRIHRFYYLDRNAWKALKSQQRIG
uniref:EF-hand domain-containing protein n=1 Tax=Brassica oleracea TaxID=3712 RepID=A0A3P6ELW7_BRAOL|nr:unnamed protein product [Brassica oleracea]